ncbi:MULTISPECIES: AAA family ATPase [unclassified Mesorhizobium]|uniref:AAA family ATPase n=1 Tax=unclassified Mesorhizobium TaxID=325217 RepID=UPI000FCB2B15|nr:MULTISPECIES: AAA family ATPase [unclassified Mesorhizobium]TGP22661.1 AAA family ATPase [Mesorhizobium sp. M1D.F.Ca.ET.231.01.1.1]TGP31060.1 AAA family ATPase [Mesorhizobium sp. M1D.F.Ca.ET.234.01.1.1]TGS45362.1 AAA family ATPase [Mesorhizobium sp. M1D.F.Ca.ET.184.01.1.1]TGS60837.1 AAA family ATPase [Mesorhizobium sp. M1D.F.Ca.ET.183.01.1.1]
MNMQTQTDLRHELWDDFQGFCEMLYGDPVLVPDPTNIDGLTRDDLTKISHWSDFEFSDIDRLAILTDSFDRFIGRGEDASVITLWRHGTPLVQQIEGEPCERTVDIIMEAICDDLPLDEIAEMQRAATAEKEGAADTKLPANDNVHPLLLRLQRLYGGQIIGDKIHWAKVPPSNVATSIVGVIDGAPWVLTPAGEQFSQLPLPPEPIRASPFKLRDPASLAERDWLFGRHYIRRYLTSTVGAGGGGKSAHAVSEALAMVTGRPLLDPDGPRTRPLRVWYVNCEDPQDEIDRRFHAAAKHFNITAEQIGDRRPAN